MSERIDLGVELDGYTGKPPTGYDAHHQPLHDLQAQGFNTEPPPEPLAPWEQELLDASRSAALGPGWRHMPNGFDRVIPADVAKAWGDYADPQPNDRCAQCGRYMPESMRDINPALCPDCFYSAGQ